MGHMGINAEVIKRSLEFISSMTGKSPSTTGAGSEGALTKGPFNCLPAVFDLNSALVSYLLTEHPAFVTAAEAASGRLRRRAAFCRADS